MKTSALSGMLVALAALALLPPGCALSGDGDLEEGGAGGMSTSGGEGAASSSSDSSTSADSSSSSGTVEPECPYEGEPILELDTLPECPNCGGGAHCLPIGLVPADFVDQLNDCEGDNKCVPDKFIDTQGLFIPETCESVAGAEGRCLNTCLPQVAEQADLLPQSTCGEHEKCTPCFDPQDQTATGACSLSCDPGPSEPPAELPKCCGGQGTCVPEAAAGSQAGQLGKDGCSQDFGSMLCAPDVFVNDINWQAQPCQTSLVSGVFGDEYLPGACLPECLPALDSFLLQEDGCGNGMKCAPCKEPPFGKDSGACDFL